MATPLGSDALRALYRTMAAIRAFDARIRRGLAAGEFAFNYWPVEGQEAISAGVCLCLAPTDRLVTTYRCVADAIAKGMPLAQLAAELLGRGAGASGGKGGAMGIHWPEAGLAASTGIVGAGAPIANGLALAAKLRGTGAVTVVSFGDGATSIGALHEAMNLAALWQLPVVFLCQNNLYGEGTPLEMYTRSRQLSDRAAGYGMPGATVDGTDPRLVVEAAREAVLRARSGGGPTFLEAVAHRLQGHYFGDAMRYVDAERLARARANEPLGRFRAELAERGEVPAAELDRIDAEVAAEVAAAVAFAARSPEPPAEALHTGVYAGRSDDGSLRSPARAPAPQPPPAGPTRELNLAGAIRQALDQAMARDPRIVLLGEDIQDPVGGVFTATQGLSTRHGAERVRATPISETAIVGAAIGAALEGLRPVAELMFMDFLGVCLDQLANHAAKLRYLTGGRASVPLVLRTTEGAGAGPQHSQSLEAWLLHVPGLKVVAASNPFDAKGLLLSAIEDDDPVVFIESMALFFDPKAVAPVPEAEYRIPIGLADRKRAGSDLTIATWGATLRQALAAADELAGEGIGAEVIDLRSLLPLDLPSVLESVARTRRLVVAHSATRFCGPGAEIAAAVAAELHGQLAAPVERVGAAFTPVPHAAALAARHGVGAAAIAAAARKTLR
jgi:2-oxoisovalerate dehydrogenase E1 component